MMGNNERLRKLKSSCLLGFLILVCVSASIILMNRNSFINQNISSPYKNNVTQNDTKTSKYVNGHILSPYTKFVSSNGTQVSKYVNELNSSPYTRYLGLNGNQLSTYVNGHPPTLFRKHVTSNGTKSSKYVNENQVLRQASVMNTGNESRNVDFPRKQTTKGVKRGIICPISIDRLGNQIFQFASAFGIAMAKNMSLVIDKNKLVNRIFKLKVQKMKNNYFCDNLKLIKEKFPAKYDSDLLRLNSSKSFRIGMYLESWKYFYNFTTELKKQLVFRQHIQNFVNNTIKGILRNFNVKSKRDVTLVGVHVRRGDKLRLINFNVATTEYLQKTVSYFKTKYDNVIFIVASDGMSWTKANMPDKIKVAYIHGRPETDMATLAACDHVITTVGTFGWWCGWLAGGEVTYFKWPVKPGSRFSKWWSYEDFFYPGWIGM